MAKLRVEFTIPDWTVAELQKAVHDLDELDAGEGNGIAADQVTAWDVISYMVSGQLGLDVAKKVIDGETTTFEVDEMRD